MPTRINLNHLAQSGATPGQSIVWNGEKWGAVTISGSNSGGTWGTITGSISAQNDLQDYFNIKTDKISLPLNVKDYGAVGDGIVDDTAAIQSAINIANGERAVLIPAGTYFIVGTITLGISGTSLVGEGMGITKLLGSGYDSVSSPVINITGNDCTISDMEATVEYGRHCVFVSGASRSIITRMYFSAGSRAAVFIHKNSQQTAISDSKFFGMAWGAIATGGDPTGNVNGPVVGVSITRNLFYDTGAEAIDINWDTHSVLISQNQFLECSETSDEIIDIGGGTPPNHCSDISIIANTFYNSSIAGRAIWCKNGSGVGTDYTERVLISENTFYGPISTGVEPYCIYATTSKNVSIINNVIQGYGRSIVLQQDATYIKISGNTIKTAYGHLIGFLGTGIGRVEVENNLFHQEGGFETAVRMTYGIFIKFSGNKFVGRVGLDCIQIGSGLQGPTLITNNQFVGGERHVKLEASAKNISLYSNQFSRAEKNCVWSLGANTNIQIINNDFHEWSASTGTWPAINMSGGNGVAISNNSFYNDISLVGDDAIQLSGIITGGMIIGNRFGNSLTGSTIVNKSNLMYGNISCNYDIKALNSLPETGFIVEDSTACPTPSSNQVSISSGTIRIGRTSDAGPDEVVRGDDSRLTGGSSITGAYVSTINGMSGDIILQGGQNIFVSQNTISLSGNIERISKKINQISHGLVSGKCVRFNGTNWIYAQADSDINSESVGIIETETSDSFELVFNGFISLPSASFTAGLVYFLDPDVSGGLTSVEPSGDGKISKPMLFATSTTTGIVYNMRGDLLSSASVVDTVHTQTISGQKTFEEFVSLNGGVNFKTQVVSTSPYYVSDTDSIILADTQSSSINIILPLNPTNGRSLRITKIHDNYTMVIDRNTRSIGGRTENITASLNEYSTDLTYSTTKSSWYRG